MLGTLLLAAAVAAPSELTFADALTATERLPEVLAARRAADRLDGAARALPPVLSQPQIAVQPGYRMLEVEQRGLEGQLSISQAIPLVDVRGAQAKVLSGEHAVRVAQSARVLLESRLAAASAWFGVWDARAELSASTTERDVAREALARVRKGAEGGAFTSADVADEEAYLAERELAVIAAEGDLFERTTELAVATGRPASNRIVPLGALPELAMPDDAAFEALLARAGELPGPLAEALLGSVERARAVEATRLQGPQLQLGAIVQREAPASLIGFGTIGLTLPVFDLALRARAPADAAADDLEGRAALATRSAAAELVRARHEVEHTAEVLATIRDRLLPALEQSARLNGVLASRSELTVLELINVRRRLAHVRVQLARATTAHALARARLALFANSLSGDVR